MPKQTSSGLAETIKTLVYAVLIAILIRSFLYEPFSIPSGSMEPTLLVGDYLFVSKFSYGFSRYSLPFGLPLIPGPGRFLQQEPHRGDVVVFKLPKDNSTDYIKRLIGLPGDRIQVQKGVLYINGEPCKRERVTEHNGTYLFHSSEGNTIAMDEYWETLPNGVRHLIALIGDERPIENTPEWTVPAGHYFMMGDDRDNSSDSRYPGALTDNPGPGFVPAENLVGHAQFIFFSTDGYAQWWEVWKWPVAIRFDRLFMGIR
jgi:signal peptidase I